MKINKSPIFPIIALFFGITLSLISAEILLRIIGYPRKVFESDKKPVIVEPDPVLGWENKPGNYLISIHEESSNDIKVTIWQNGSRATQSQRCEKTKRIIIVGGSFTQGWAISDNETFAWKLQQKFPSIEFLNYGTVGYGTYQSLLILKRVLADSPPPIMVLYGFIGHHECRNVAVWHWRKSLSRHVYLPYCTICPDGTLVNPPPEAYPMWPLKESLATVIFLEDLYMRFKTRERAHQKRAVTEKLLLEMSTLLKEKGSKLVVLLFDCEGRIKSHYIKFLTEKGIDFIDCTHPKDPTLEMKVPHVGHPNEAMNSFWANCIEEFIRNEIYEIRLFAD